MESTLIIKPETLRTREGQSAIGDIWLQIGDEAFPEEGWNDFVVVLLGWWANGLVRLALNSRATEQIRFMEGPYGVSISISSPGILQLRALAGANLQNEVTSGETDLKAFAQNVMTTGREILRICSQQGCRGRDENALDDALRRLEREFTQRRDGGRTRE